MADIQVKVPKAISLGIVAILLSGFSFAGGLVWYLGTHYQAAVEWQDRTDRRFLSMDAKLNKIDGRVDKLDDRFDRLSDQVARVETRILNKQGMIESPAKLGAR